jgi:hypothetical protein
MIGAAGATQAGEVRVSYTLADGTRLTKSCELLVIACDPTRLHGICDYDAQEKEIFGKLQKFTFHTTLMEVKAKPAFEHGVIFAPGPLDAMEGHVYGFRNETAKQFGLITAQGMDRNLVTVYQLQGPSAHPWSGPDFDERLRLDLAAIDWWPYGQDWKIFDTVTTPYFDHFSNPDLIAELPWKLLQMQGERHTLYVHGSACFESVLDCWAYSNMMLDSGIKLPEKRDAEIVILGAGPSGLLFADRLRRLGYTRVEILELTDRYGGKTHTKVLDNPHPKDSYKPTVCELGTCYLSPAYDDLVKYLKPFLKGNRQIGFGDSSAFRGIVIKGQLPPEWDLPPIVSYPEYILYMAEYIEKLPKGITGEPAEKATAVLVDQLNKYLELHKEFMGGQSPMPRRPPEKFLKSHAAHTFLDFLKYYQIGALIGLLQYGYSVQGYGNLANIPAYYGLVWVTPPVVEAIRYAFLHPESDKPIVTAWSRGWGAIWDQMQVGLNITFHATIHEIVRPGRGP